MASDMFRAHKTTREERSDGTILLRSGYEQSAVAQKTTDWLERWARETPQATFLAERSGAGWREVGYGAAHEMVEALARGLMGQGFAKGDRILVISGNSVNHGLLTLAAQMIGLITMPVAEQYALIPDARGQLDYFAGLLKPRGVYAEDRGRFGAALDRPVFTKMTKIVSEGPLPGDLAFEALLQGAAGDLEAAKTAVGPDDVVKMLSTSGSTSTPKGVPTTHRMMCVNQTQLVDAMPFIAARPPRLVDWLPWSHVFGSSHNFNIVLSNGGSLHIDAGKPSPALIGQTLENLLERSATLAFNVPAGFAMLRDAMRDDAALRTSYFRDLDMVFYAGASLPPDVFDDLKAMAQEVRGKVPLFTTSWGLTETAPAALSQHQPSQVPGAVGVPMTGVTVKLLPLEDGRAEVRVKGPNVFAGYLDNPEQSEAAFDDEGFFRTGDVMSFVDPDNPSAGLKFEGRLSEDFKLMSGTWVRAATLRLELLAELKPFVQDLVICGPDHSEIGLLVFLSAEGLALTRERDAGALWGGELAETLRERLMPRKGAGASRRVARVLACAEAPRLEAGEVTAKGNLNSAKLMRLRVDLITRLYDDSDQAVIRI